MKKLGCAKCGGTKKMKAGGSTKSVSISKPGAGVVKETKGNTNQKMGIYGVAQTGPTGPNNSGIATMKKGGAVKKPLAKARVGMSTGPGKPKTAVQGVKDFGKYVSTFGGATEKKSNVSKNKKTGMDALKDLGKYVSTFGLATEKYNPAPKKTAVKTKKK